jgi:hypothetical protein
VSRILVVVVIALTACGGGTPKATPVPKPEPEPAAVVPVAAPDPFGELCDALLERCPGKDRAACVSMLDSAYGRREGCLSWSGYTDCAGSCMPSVDCAEDVPLECAAGCGQIECAGDTGE